MENRLQKQYGAPSTTLEKSFEYQNFDLVNAERKQHGLNTLDYSKKYLILQENIVKIWLKIIILSILI